MSLQRPYRGLVAGVPTFALGLPPGGGTDAVQLPDASFFGDPWRPDDLSTGLVLFAATDVFSADTVAADWLGNGVVLEQRGGGRVDLGRLYRAAGNDGGLGIWRGNVLGDRPGIEFGGINTAYNTILGTPGTYADFTIAWRMTVGVGGVVVWITDGVGAGTARVEAVLGAGGITATDGAATVAHSAVIAAQTPYFCVLTCTAAGVATLTVNGVTVVGALNPVAFFLNNLLWGFTPAFAPFGGTMSAWLAWTRVLTAAEIAQVTTWGRWPRDRLPSANRTLFLAAGNSIEAGTSSGSRMSAEVALSLTSTFQRFDTAIPGQDSAYFVANFDVLIARYITSPVASGSLCVFFYLEGENGVLHDGVAGEYALQASLATQAKALGAVCLFETVTPRSGTGIYDPGPAYEGDRIALNALLRAPAFAALARLADVGADVILGDPATLTNLTYYVLDGAPPDEARVHFTATGQTRAVALYVLPGVNALGLV